MKLKKAKQICALIGVILLIALYLSTLIFALMDHGSMALLKASIYATVIVPVLIWAMGMVARLLKKHYSDTPENILPENEQMNSPVNTSDNATRNEQHEKQE